MPVLIVSQGLNPGDAGAPGTYLQDFDPDAMDGAGVAHWTSDKALAKRYADTAAAMTEWKRPSTIKPLRPDGKPNRPLTAYSITFEDVGA